MKNKPIIFSASMLQDFADCPRRFELKYLRRQLWPAIPAEPIQKFERMMELGRQFHTLANQYFSGVPADNILHVIQDPTLRTWFNHFTEFKQQLTAERAYSEFQLSGLIGSNRFTAVYDLIQFSGDGKIAIFDWKTSTHPPRSEQYHRRMQSLVYPVLLANNLDQLKSEKNGGNNELITMTYWFPAYPENPISLEFNTQDTLENSQLIKRITDEIQKRIDGSDFPRTEELKLCKFCMYRSMCERGISAGSIDDESEISADFIEIDFDALQDLDLEI